MIELQTSTKIKGLAMAQARIDLSRLAENISIVQAKLAGRAGLLFTIKADAYGHGAAPVAQFAQSAGVDALGVAHLPEALRLRRAGIELPILVLGLSYPHHIPILAESGEDIAITIDSLDFARGLNREARRLGTRPKVQVKVDTGLGRVGIAPAEVLSFFRGLRQFRHLQVEGVFSHLSAANSRDAADRAYTLAQIEGFANTLWELDRAGLLPPLRHIANSAGLIDYREKVTSGFFNLVRPGILLYGHPELHADWTRGIRPIMSVHTWIATTKAVPQGAYLGYGRSYRASRPLRTAIIPVGYEDGLDVRLSNRGQVAIRGERAPILGRISMDQAIVDISHLSGISIGDEVELLGDHLSAAELAHWSEAPCVEVMLTHIGRRVERVYVDKRNGHPPP